MSQQENTELILPPISDEYLKQLKDREEQFPILKDTEDSYKLWELQQDVERALNALIDELDYRPITAAIQNWLKDAEKFKEETQTKYATCIMDLISRKIIPTAFADGQPLSVGGLRYIDQKSIIQSIEHITDLSEIEKIKRIECYIEFSKFLDGMTRGWFTRGQFITYKKRSAYRVTLKAVEKALTPEDWKNFNVTLANKNYRDSLIALTMFYGIARISDVLMLTIDQVDFTKNIIRFSRKKNNIIHEIPVEYPEEFMKKLNNYVDSTQKQRIDTKYVFITRTGRPLTRSRINHSFTQASKEAKIKRVNPDTMRATCLALNQRLKNIINEVPIEE